MRKLISTVQAVSVAASICLITCIAKIRIGLILRTQAERLRGFAAKEVAKSCHGRLGEAAFVVPISCAKAKRHVRIAKVVIFIMAQGVPVIVAAAKPIQNFPIKAVGVAVWDEANSNNVDVTVCLGSRKHVRRRGRCKKGWDSRDSYFVN